MKLIEKYLEVITANGVCGDIIPIQCVFVDIVDGLAQHNKYNVEVLDMKTDKDNETVIYNCKGTMCGQEKLFELRLETQKSKWSLFI